MVESAVTIATDAVIVKVVLLIRLIKHVQDVTVCVGVVVRIHAVRVMSIAPLAVVRVKVRVKQNVPMNVDLDVLVVVGLHVQVHVEAVALEHVQIIVLDHVVEIAAVVQDHADMDVLDVLDVLHVLIVIVLVCKDVLEHVQATVKKVANHLVYHLAARRVILVVKDSYLVE